MMPFVEVKLDHNFIAYHSTLSVSYNYFIAYFLIIYLFIYTFGIYYLCHYFIRQSMCNVLRFFVYVFNAAVCCTCHHVTISGAIL